MDLAADSHLIMLFGYSGKGQSRSSRCCVNKSTEMLRIYCEFSLPAIPCSLNCVMTMGLWLKPGVCVHSIPLLGRFLDENSDMKA